ncbi:glycosyltransferase family 9 protein [Microlunatus flavus]|uniref:ADP-heptose:LPS heptosyltransferase n=1 Tax=Microlunatus flavus TaxID=1036181 RepID=A0A1H8ZKS2_9ACTN|nr:glycosyltransferase family 9 protein [Microlunatus flavus]SEP64867.1 ADP-heptose:LPS heptosyltransferase [Microlunatus flavus]
MSAPHGHVLVARLDSVGDILLAGPAVRAVAASAARVTMLVGRGRAPVARLLPGVDDVIEFEAPWVVPDPGGVDPAAVDALVAQVRAARVDAGLVLTSFHQSPLPLALLLRMAGVGWLGAISEDYPGSLLDLRHLMPDAPADVPESERALALARAAGFTFEGPARLEVRHPLPDVSALVGEGPYVVYHPGADAPARRPSAGQSRTLVAALVAAGHRVVVTGSPVEADLTGTVAQGQALDLTGAVDLAGLAAVLEGAQVVVAPNTGPAHLAAAVGTPVVSLFAPVVPPERWAPYGVPVVLLGDQDAPCRLTRARHCPVPGHPCLDGVDPDAVVAAVATLRLTPPAGTTVPARTREVDHVS